MTQKPTDEELEQINEQLEKESSVFKKEIAALKKQLKLSKLNVSCPTTSCEIVIQ